MPKFLEKLKDKDNNKKTIIFFVLYFMNLSLNNIFEIEL